MVRSAAESLTLNKGILLVLSCITFQVQEAIHEDNLVTFISGFYRNNKVFNTIVLVEDSPNLTLDTVFLQGNLL